jgi:hypothetical protein
MPPSPSRVAVVIATRNRGPELLGTLTRLLALSERPRIVVVDNGSTDGTAELVRARHPDVQVVCQEMADSPLQPADDLPGPPLLGFIACGAVVRRDAFLEVGGFDARLGVGGEEELLALDLAARGWGLAYVDEVVAHHYPSPSRDPADRRRLLVRNALWSACSAARWVVRPDRPPTWPPWPCTSRAPGRVCSWPWAACPGSCANAARSPAISRPPYGAWAEMRRGTLEYRELALLRDQPATAATRPTSPPRLATASASQPSHPASPPPGWRSPSSSS